MTHVGRAVDLTSAHQRQRAPEIIVQGEPDPPYVEPPHSWLERIRIERPSTSYTPASSSNDSQSASPGVGNSDTSIHRGNGKSSHHRNNGRGGQDPPSDSRDNWHDRDTWNPGA